ncbi:MAG: hypothetical protein ABIQ59_07645 [Nocardioidaceae bacterium]
MTTRAVDRLLQIFVALLPVLAGVGFGFFLIRQDTQQSGEFLDGIGVYSLAAGALGAVGTLLFAFFYAPAVAAMVPALLVVATAVAARSGTGDTFGA